jgi:hypothetical protein
MYLFQISREPVLKSFEEIYQVADSQDGKVVFKHHDDMRDYDDQIGYTFRFPSRSEECQMVLGQNPQERWAISTATIHDYGEHIFREA